MKTLPKPAVYAILAFMAAWQATDFSIEYRAVMGAVAAALFGFLNPKPADKSESSEPAE